MPTALLPLAFVITPAFACAHAEPLDAESASVLVETLPTGEARLLHPGEGEARALRVTPSDGTAYVYRLHVHTQNTTYGETGEDQALCYTLHTTWGSDSETASRTKRTEILEIAPSDSLPDSMEDAHRTRLADSLADIVGSAWTDTLDDVLAPKGERSYDGADVHYTSNLLKRFTRATGVLILPIEPVSVGAVWRTRHEYTNSTGLTFSTIATYSLDELDDDNAVIEFDTFSILPAITEERVYDGVTITSTTSIEGEGAGHLALDLRTGAVTEIWCSAELRSKVDFRGGGTTQSHPRTSSTTLIIEPAPADTKTDTDADTSTEDDQEG